MEKSKNNEKLYRLIQTIAIVGMFVSVALVIMMGFEYIKYSSGMLALVLIILVVSVCCMMTLPWVKVLSKGEFKILCYVMFGLTAFSCILWIVDIIVGIKIADAIKAENAGLLIGQLRFLKISLIISFQIIVTNSIATFVVKYRKTMIAFQVVTYISQLFLDFYGSIALASVKIGNNGFEPIANAGFLSNKLTIMFAIMALAFVAISNGIIRNMDRRRQREGVPMFGDDKLAKQKDDKSVQAQLKELKSLLEQNLITEEEYAKKRDDLINQL